jgi:hypothetical protein
MVIVDTPLGGDGGHVEVAEARLGSAVGGEFQPPCPTGVGYSLRLYGAQPESYPALGPGLGSG